MAENDKFIGTNIDGFLVEKLLGRGGMGVVYRAVETGLSRPVAIKILPETALTDNDAVQRFDREARIVAQLNHPNIAQIYGIGQVDDAPYYVMEYIEGRSLEEILKEKGRLAGTRGVKIMIQAAKGLKAASEQGVIHRDIKPGNLMVTEDDKVKVVDFGIAKAFQDDTFKTATGLIMGTPRYLSPEQGRGVEKLDMRSDIYSLGATFYHMVTGNPPFDADNPITLIQKHITKPVVAIQEFNANVPEKLCNIIYRMLEKLPADRFQDYNELIIALENVAGIGSGITTYNVERDEPLIGTSGEENPWKSRALVSVMVFALILVVASFFRDGGNSDNKAAADTEVPTNRTKIDELSDGIHLLRNLQKEDQKDLE